MPRMTGPTRQILDELLDATPNPRYGLELGAATGLPSGTVHPVLARLESIGWVMSDWEDIDPSAAGRPRRRYYRLTPDGVREASAALAAAEVRRRRLNGRLSAVEQS